MHFEYHDIVLNKDIDYHYNPFGGIDDEDILSSIEPKHSIRQWVKLLNNQHPIIIEFSGEKGRGKTTHLTALHNHFANSDIYFLDRIDKKIKRNRSSIVFIDSVENISFIKRFWLWSKKKTSYVITTHKSKNKEYRIAKRNYQSFTFEGINTKELNNIICNRIDLASDFSSEKIRINDDALSTLITHFNDDFRGILNYLYDNFKKAQR